MYHALRLIQNRSSATMKMSECCLKSLIPTNACQDPCIIWWCLLKAIKIISTQSLLSTAGQTSGATVAAVTTVVIIIVIITVVTTVIVILFLYRAKHSATVTIPREAKGNEIGELEIN